MAITILTEDKKVADALKDSAPQGVRVSIRYPHIPDDGRMTRAYHGITVTIQFLREHSQNIGDGLIAIWLYDKIKGKAAQIFHRGERIVPEEPAIGRMVQEEFDFVRSDEYDESDDA
jgi:hypothetical protein